MIDIHGETLVDLCSIPGRFPPNRKGNRISLTTCFRWASRGCRGVVLETVRVGSRLVTSEQALERFVAALSRPSGGEVAMPRPAKARSKASERAGRQLQEAGI
jgi:hypothetical protein